VLIIESLLIARYLAVAHFMQAMLNGVMCAHNIAVAAEIQLTAYIWLAMH
jgi:hypothetical protein